MSPVLFRRLLIGLAVLAPAPALQAQAAEYRTAPSGLAMTEISITRAMPANTPAAERPAPRTVRITYGQPHARGRTILGTVVPLDSVWRLGANAATSLVTELDLTLGGTRLTKGSYTLFARPTAAGWRLIVSRKVGETANQYDPSADVAVVPTTARSLSEPRESFTMTLVPDSATSLTGRLVFAWGTFEVTVPYVAHP